MHDAHGMHTRAQLTQSSNGHQICYSYIIKHGHLVNRV